MDFPIIYSYLSHSFDHVKISKLTNLPIVHWNTKLLNINNTLINQHSYIQETHIFPYTNSFSIIVATCILVTSILICHFKIKSILAKINKPNSISSRIPVPIPTIGSPPPASTPATTSIALIHLNSPPIPLARTSCNRI